MEENENKNKINIKEEDMKTKSVFYSEEVKKYLKMNVQDEEYSKLISEDPIQLFSTIDQIQLTMFEANLYKYL